MAIDGGGSVNFSFEADSDEEAAYYALNTLGWYLGRDDGYDDDEEDFQ